MPIREGSAVADNWRVMVGAAVDRQAQAWKYTTEQPGGAWMNAGFNDATWSTGRGGFGAKGGFESQTHTPWDTKDIWLRQQFQAIDIWSQARLVLHFDNATEVYINGELVWKSQPNAWNDGYQMFDITSKLKSVLKSGTNTIAIHCHQDDGGQFIDAALIVR
jgi:beta-galactosidase